LSSFFLPTVEERVTLSCGLPLASVVVWEDPVTWAIAPMEETIRPATTTLASEPALLLGNQTLGKKERLFIRYRPRCLAQRPRSGWLYSKCPAGFMLARRLAPA
jgi:hypothetical protein